MVPDLKDLHNQLDKSSGEESNVSLLPPLAEETLSFLCESREDNSVPRMSDRSEP